MCGTQEKNHQACKEAGNTAHNEKNESIESNPEGAQM